MGHAVTNKSINFDPDFASPADYARMYRALGIQAVPAKMPSEDKAWKRPIIKWREYENELTDDATFDGWYGVEGDFRARTNMGMITGHASSNVWILDLDFHSKPQAKKWLQNLLDKWNDGIPLRSATQRTGGGGIQIMLYAPEGWTPPTNKTSMGVDIRGQGGFAMLPPSLHESGKHYDWIKGYEPWLVGVLLAPSWLIEAIEELLSQFATVERGERTDSPGQAVDGFGQIVDGREDYMTRLIWARVVSLYRDAPFINETVSISEMRDAFITYTQNVKTRLFEPGIPNHMLLEREGRGISLFEAKWREAMKQWDHKVRDAAALPAPEKKLETPQERQQDEDLANPDANIMDDIYDLVDVRGIKAMLDQVFLIDGIMPEKSLGWIYGAPGCGKSFIVLGIALSIAAGLDTWWGRKIHRSGPVVYISSEGVADMKFRIRAWEIALGINADDIPFYLIHQPMNFMKEEDKDKLLRTINKVVLTTGELPVLSVVDTVSRVLPGADENLQKDMTLFIGACDEVKETFGCTVVGVHHSSRAGNLRGSTVFDGAGDFVLGISREEGSEIGELYAKKIKAAPDGWKQYFKLRKVDLGDIGGHSSLYAEATDESNDADEKQGWPSKPVCQEVLHEMRRAWEENKPWSNHYHAKKEGRYAQTHMYQHWDIETRLANDMIEQWLTNGIIENAVFDTKNKGRGLRVLQNLYDGASMPGRKWSEKDD